MNAPISLRTQQMQFASLPLERQLREIVGTRAEREFTLDRANADKEARTVWMSIASERPYERYWGIETLDVSKTAMRTERLDNGAPILVDHTGRDVVGVIEKWQIAADKKLRVLARFGTSTRAEEVWQDVLAGIRRSTSIGYIIHKAVLTEQGTDVNSYRVTDWEPLEGSLVSVPADPSVGPGRSLSQIPEHKESSEMEHEDTATVERTEPSDLSADLRTSDDAARADERKRVAKRNAEILAIGEQWPDHGGRELALKAIADPSQTVESFKSNMLKTLAARHRPMDTGRVERQPDGGGTPFGMAPREMIAASNLRAFSGVGKILGKPDHECAYRAGMWAMAAIHGNPQAIRFCQDNGVQLVQGSREQMGFQETRTMTEGVFTSAGWLVPVEMESAIIANREQYGVMRRICNVIPMSVASTSLPRITGDTSAYFVGEGSSGTTSDPAGDQVTLTLRDLMALTHIGKSTAQDTVIALAEMVAREQARAFSIKEDACAIIGDGTSTYGGMRGVATLLQDSNYAGGAYTAASGHDTFAEIDVSDVTGLIGILPIYARTGARWLASGVADAMVFGRLKLNAGGNDVQTVQGQIVEGSYAGFPISLDQYMPAGGGTDYSALTMIIIGNFQLGVAFGSGSGMMMTVDPYTLAHQNLTRIITTERIDIVAHGVNRSTTVAGPIVGLLGQ